MGETVPPLEYKCIKMFKCYGENTAYKSGYHHNDNPAADVLTCMFFWSDSYVNLKGASVGVLNREQQ